MTQDEIIENLRANLKRVKPDMDFWSWWHNIFDIDCDHDFEDAKFEAECLLDGYEEDYNWDNEFYNN